MSITMRKKTIDAACAYNAKSTYLITPAILARFPALSNPRGSEDFAFGVLNAQADHLGFRAEETDGKLGYQTYTALCKHCEQYTEEYLIYHGRRIAMPLRTEYTLLTFDEPLGKDLHRFGNFGKRTAAPSAVCLHWGGLNAQHCFNVFASDTRQVSSHFLIGKTDASKVVVYQILDLNHCAWHAGSVNQFTIGVDICQTPETHFFDHYRVERAGVHSVQKIYNSTGRGPTKVLSLDPVLARGASLFIKDLLSALSFPLITPPTHNVYPDLRKFTLFGHHHSNSRKYDIACWWDALGLPAAAPASSYSAAAVEEDDSDV